jgi:hypothetical protein
MVQEARLPLVQRLWLPFRFPSTNDLLDMLRAEGYYEGRGYGRKGGAPKPPESSYSKAAREIRDAANMHARAARLRALPLVSLRFELLGCARFDPSAWTLPAKSIEDGLVDARVIISDRFNVFDVSGRCVRGGDGGRGLIERARVLPRPPECPVGMLVTLTEVIDDGQV